MKETSRPKLVPFLPYSYFALTLFAAGILLTIPAATAKTVIWLRGEIEAGALLNAAPSGEMFDAVTSPQSTSSEEVAGAWIFDPVEGKSYPNKVSFLNGRQNFIPATLESDSVIAKLINKGSFTIEAIAKTDHSDGGYQLLFGQKNFSLGTSSDNHLRFVAAQDEDSAVTVVVGDPCPENQWFSLVAVGNRKGEDTTVKLYLNGALVGEKTFVGGLSVSPNEMYRIAAINPWNGPIDELRISDQALEPSQFLKAVNEAPAEKSK